MKNPGKIAPKGFRPFPFSYHEEIELEIQTLTNMGKGLARTADDWVIFIPFCLPGERVLARIYRNEKNFSEADLISIITRSPERTSPRCDHFGECGGCQYQHLGYEHQLKWKRRQLEDLLLHMAGVSFEVSNVTPSPEQYGYRSKITPHFNRPKNGEINAIGFQRAGRRQLIDIDQCSIAHPGINQALPGLRDTIRQSASNYKKGATLLLRTDANNNLHDNPQDIAIDRVGSVEFQYPAGSFFQNNPFILDQFTSYVRTEAASGNATHMIDAYCGAGLFALTAAPLFKSIAGIEVSEDSIQWAIKNAQINSIENVQFITGKVEEFFQDIKFPENETAVVIDPPRKGCSKDFLSQLFSLAPCTVVYVSCNPATQLRDLLLFQAAGYELARVQPFDLFPQTKHLECVMTLNKSQLTHDEP